MNFALSGGFPSPKSITTYGLVGLPIVSIFNVIVLDLEAINNQK